MMMLMLVAPLVMPTSKYAARLPVPVTIPGPAPVRSKANLNTVAQVAPGHVDQHSPLEVSSRVVVISR
jgi:hypothetical protein